MMLTDFINQTKDFLRKSDMRIHEPTIRSVVFSSGGRTVHHWAMVDVWGRPQISSNILFHSLVFFSLLDANVDAGDSTLEGRTFQQKYVRLPSSTDQEVITKECYRILKLFRNASTHSRSSITVNNDLITIAYTFSGTNFELEITQLGLELIYTHLLNAYASESEPETYRLGLARALYDDIANSVTRFSDDNGVSLLSISSGLRLKRALRYRVQNAAISVDNNVLEITTPYSTDPIEMGYAGVDYRIEHNGDFYLIPEEVLGLNHEIKLSDILEWKL